MTPQLAIGFAVEAMLVLASILFLTQPRFLFRAAAKPGARTSGFVAGLGLAFLLLTFVWSVILGCAMGVAEMTLSL